MEYGKIKISSNRSFGLVFCLIFALIAFWSFRGEFEQINILPGFISLVFLILGLLNSKLLTPLNKIWFKFGLFLGSIISPIIMSLIFFLVLTPIGLFMRILGKDLLNKEYNSNPSYWIKRNKSTRSMKKQF